MKIVKPFSRVRLAFAGAAMSIELCDCCMCELEESQIGLCDDCQEACE